MKIYTKKGDGGTTALINKQNVPKHEDRIEAYGTVDELNAWVGLLADMIPQMDKKLLLKEIQNQLFVVSSQLAQSPEGKAFELPVIVQNDIQQLEQQIDDMTGQLPRLTSFIMMGGHLTVSYCHIARTVCRRAERRVSKIAETAQEYLALKYLNRLSDYLFTLSRYISDHLEITENPYPSAKNN